MRCTAKSKQSGEQCKRHAVAGKEVCTIHGGKSLGGIASPTLTTGKYSKYMPERLLERYQLALADEDKLALNEEIALVDARLADLLGRVDTGESGAAWGKLSGACADLRKAYRAGNGIETLYALSVLEGLIEQGASDYLAWNELQSLVQQRRALVESERKRRVEMQQNITAEQAMLLVGALLDSVRRNVTDRDTLSAIQAEFVALTTREDRHRISAD